MFRKMTPVLIVDTIESQLPFWMDRLGFEKTVEVPTGDALGFVILSRNDVELMLQSRASVAEDVPDLAGDPACSHLFVEVDDIGAIEARLEGLQIVVPRRKTFYGAQEVGVRDPAGNLVVFAEFDEPEQTEEP